MPKIIENLKSDILETAKDVLREKGFQDFSIRTVAKKLNIAPATIYNYFPSKESILNALVNESWEYLMGEMDREIEAADSAMEAMEAIYRLLQKAMNPVISHCITMDAVIPEDHPSGATIMEKKQGLSRELMLRIERILEKFGKDVSQAEVFTTLFIMCSHHRTLSFDAIVKAVKSLQQQD